MQTPQAKANEERVKCSHTDWLRTMPIIVIFPTQSKDINQRICGDCGQQQRLIDGKWKDV